MSDIPFPLANIGWILAISALALILLVGLRFALALADARRDLGARCSIPALARAAHARGALPARAFVAMSALLLAAALAAVCAQLAFPGFERALARGPRAASEPLDPSVLAFLSFALLSLALHVASHFAYYLVERDRDRARTMARAPESREALAREIELAAGSARSRAEAEALAAELPAAGTKGRAPRL